MRFDYDRVVTSRIVLPSRVRPFSEVIFYYSESGLHANGDLFITVANNTDAQNEIPLLYRLLSSTHIEYFKE